MGSSQINLEVIAPHPSSETEEEQRQLVADGEKHHGPFESPQLEPAASDEDEQSGVSYCDRRCEPKIAGIANLREKTE